MLQLDYMLVIKRLLECYFKLKLLLTIEWLERVFRNHFSGKYGLQGADFDKFVATSKAALSKKLSFNIFLRRVLYNELAFEIFADLDLCCLRIRDLYCFYLGW